MSSINPNNIDGTYPIAGQDNDSQGFRDNFTNIKNNFTFTKSELEDLQSKAILKSALSGGTLNNNLNYAQLIAAQLLKTVETINAITSPASGAVNVSWNNGSYQTITSTSGSITVTLADWPTAGFFTKLRLAVYVSNVAHTISVAAGPVYVNLSGISGASSNTITPKSIGWHIFDFTTSDNGTNITVVDVLRPHVNAVTANVTANTISTSTTTGALVVAGGVGVAGNVVSGTGVRVTSATGKLGYNGGGNVTQATNKYTGVTLDTVTGTITMVNTAMANGNVATFTLTNSVIESNDYILVQHQSVGTLGAYVCTASPNSGNAQIHVTKLTTDAGSLSQAIVLRFAVIKSDNG
jgi:hypothetical protein